MIFLTCTKCNNKKKYRGTRKSTSPYVCSKCSRKPVEVITIPEGKPHRCITCRLEYMRKDDEPLQCYRCDSMRKHNLSGLDKGAYV